MPYEYFSDEDRLREWLTLDKNLEEFQRFLKRNIYDCTDHEDYITVKGGSRKMHELSAKEILLYKED